MSQAISMPPVLGFAAYSGVGKTSLLVQLIPLLRQQGLRIGMIKHAHHNFDTDKPGKDSYELRHAGVQKMLVGSRRRWALMVEIEEHDEPTLADMLEHMPWHELDLILVEGFKHEQYPKIELHRYEVSEKWLYPEDPNLIAVATDSWKDLPGRTITAMDINQPTAIADFIMRWLAREILFNRRYAHH